MVKKIILERENLRNAIRVILSVGYFHINFLLKSRYINYFGGLNIHIVII